MQEIVTLLYDGPACHGSLPRRQPTSDSVCTSPTRSLDGAACFSNTMFTFANWPASAQVVRGEVRTLQDLYLAGRPRPARTPARIHQPDTPPSLAPSRC
jgi:hypothetical protein